MRCLAILLSACTLLPGAPAAAGSLDLKLRSQSETSPGSNRFHRTESTESWATANTAIIVCDMWDSHHCYRAVQRVKELAPRMDSFLQVARQQGVTIIHAPSDCLDAYTQHPARLRALNTPAASSYPDSIGDWCNSIASEDPENYPIDQSDGGEDDSPEEHAKWEAELKALGRNPDAPWVQQTELITIDPTQDFITDRGREVWNILQQRNIDHVILVGVHTNMCVLGRPFGLRRLSEAGKQVVLCRDLTDTMYNPRSWPYVSHFSGTDLIVDYIERWICPTISSDQLLGGLPFRFSNDQRPHLAIVISEPEYETERTLPLFAKENLQADYRLSFVYGSEADGQDNSFPGVSLLAEADAALLSVRRRTPLAQELYQFRQFVRAGKPVLGIRTANHAFCRRNEPAPEGYEDWPEWDGEVFGGSYTNHYGRALTPIVSLANPKQNHPILDDFPETPIVSGGSLYRVAPLANGTHVLLSGKVDGHPAEPVAWTFQRADGGRSFYTSLGAPADFDHPAFQTLLRNAIAWATE